MKTIRHYIYLLSFFCCLLPAGKVSAQACAPSFTYSTWPNGFVTFTSTSTSTLAGTTYSWNFGNSSSMSGVNLSVITNSYTTNGAYVVTLSISGCTTVATQTISVNTAAIPTCSMLIAYSPVSSTVCSASASVISVSNICGPPSYSWNPGSQTSSVATGLCPNTVYTVTAFSSPGSNCCSMVSGTVMVPTTTCNLSASFIQIPGSNGAVTFSSTSTGTIAGTTYIWQYGDGTPNGTGPVSPHTYTNNGTYNAVLIAFNGGGCMDSSAVQPVSVSNVTCGLVPSFSVQSNGSGNYTFISTSTGTTAGTTYSWNFGDGSAPGAGATAIHTYSVNTIYTIILTVANSSIAGCQGSTTQTISVNTAASPCILSANFNYTLLPGGIGIFNNLSTGTTGSTTYTWNFSGSQSITVASPVSHQFTLTGIKFVQLTASNNSAPTCTSVATQTVYVSCSLNASYTHTVGSLGQVSFESTSTGTNPATSYLWDFGDGVYTGGKAPFHTYINAGAYLVKLKTVNGDSTCRDSVMQYINVTGIPCIANSNFTLTPTGTPQYWNATPSYPWNVSNASWDWGDGSVSNTLYSSHAYAVAGSYAICLSVTLSCGSTGSTCTSYAVYRAQATEQNMNIVYVNVTKPGLSTSIAGTAAPEQIAYQVYPNPNDGRFSLSLPGAAAGPLQVAVYTITGQTVYEASLEQSGSGHVQEIDLQGIATGLYFIKVSSGSQSLTKKITVQK